MEDQQVKASVTELMSDAGLETRDLSIEPAGGGGNNRVFVVHAPDTKYLAKVYFSHASDTRDRLGTEYAFLSYAWNIGLRCIPRPISRSSGSNIGLYEYVEGRKLTSLELDSERLSQAARFFRDLNARSNRDLAGLLSKASEACFSMAEHFALVDRRIERLVAFPNESPADRQALSFIAELGSAWQQIKDRISRQAGPETIAAVLRVPDRCISPSDFGFHNAIVRQSGAICFIDFEYAGWDDPAKAVGDFFCQPAVPVSLDYFEDYMWQALNYSENAPALAERVRMLFPVFQIKWCCIMLNEFLPDAAQRRHFANPAEQPELRKQAQLQKAQLFFKSIRDLTWPT